MPLSKTDIHPTAIVEKGAKLGSGCVIGPGAIVGSEVELGEGCIVGPRAVLEFVGRESGAERSPAPKVEAAR
ncbi:MAG: hypothetical protein EBT50_03510, partial [Verrucomicrobia bacterium]|nr:hypothetical protein [Verrucomicrobiota bacterium]